MNEAEGRIDWNFTILFAQSLPFPKHSNLQATSGTPRLVHSVLHSLQISSSRLCYNQRLDSQHYSRYKYSVPGSQSLVSNMHGDDASETGTESEVRDPEVIKDAKQRRSTAKRLFSMSAGAMSAAISRQESITEVHQLFTIVDQRFTALQERYADYLSCLLSDDDETPEADSHWIEGCTAAFMKAKMDFQGYKESNDVRDAQKETPKMTAMATECTKVVVKDEIKRAKRAVKFERSMLRSRIQNLDSALLEASATVSVIHDTQTDMKMQLEKYLTVQRELIVQLSDDDEADQEMLVTEKMQAMCIDVSVKDFDTKTII